MRLSTTSAFLGTEEPTIPVSIYKIGNIVNGTKSDCSGCGLHAHRWSCADCIPALHDHQTPYVKRDGNSLDKDRHTVNLALDITSHPLFVQFLREFEYWPSSLAVIRNGDLPQ